MNVTTSPDAGVRDLLLDVQQKQRALQTAIEALTERVGSTALTADNHSDQRHGQDEQRHHGRASAATETNLSLSATEDPGNKVAQTPPPSHTSDRQGGSTSRIILTTYPKQIGIDPLMMDWGNADPLRRGPVVVSRSQSSIRRRNAIGGTYRMLKLSI